MTSIFEEKQMAFERELKEKVDTILTNTPAKYVFPVIHRNGELETELADNLGYIILKINNHHVDTTDGMCDYTVSGSILFRDNTQLTQIANFNLMFEIEYNSDDEFITMINQMGLTLTKSIQSLNVLLKIT